MISTGSIQAALASLKAATAITKGFLELKSIAEVQGKVIELQTVILSAQSDALAAQSDQSALLERVRELEGQVAKLEAWEAEKQRYQLTDFGGGTFAYVLKEEVSGGEPIHRLCSACYEQGQKSILQFQYQDATRRDRYTCPACKEDFHFGEYHDPPVAGRAISDYDPIG